MLANQFETIQDSCDIPSKITTTLLCVMFN